MSKKKCILEHRKRISVELEEYFILDVKHKGHTVLEFTCLVEGLEIDLKKGWKAVIHTFPVKQKNTPH